jgi:hypothetical protein
MRARTFRLVCLLSCLAMATAALAQEGHPLKGSWRGDWGPSPTDRNHVVLVLDWDGKNITGTVNPGPQALPIKSATLNITPGTPAVPATPAQGATPARPGTPATPPIFGVHLEVDAKDARGTAVTYIIDGTIENLGLPNRSIVGTWNHGNVKGDFKVTRQ